VKTLGARLFGLHLLLESSDFLLKLCALLVRRVLLKERIEEFGEGRIFVTFLVESLYYET
jgi:hypothetical protein